MKQFLLFLFVSFILSAFDGKAQTALEFDGVDDYVQTTYPGIFENNPRTMMAWIYLSETPTVDMCILDFGFDDDGQRNTFMVNEDGYLQFDMGGDMLTATFGGTLPTDEWVHVAFVYDAGEGFLYVNGGLGDNGYLDLLTPEDGEPLRIGESILGGMPFKGMIDEISVWDMAVAEEDITDYYCIDGTAIPANVVAYYDFNDGTGTTLTELVNGWDGTLMNMTEDDWVASNVCATPYNVTFVVTKDDNVTPIENAEVDLDGVVQYTDASGETVFESFPGTYNYTVSKAGYFDESSTVDVVDADVTVYESMTLNGINYDITFLVTDGTNPLENALVDLDGLQQYTNASGETIFTDVLPETYPYYVTKDGYLPSAGDVEVVDANVTVNESLLVEQSTALEFDGLGYVETTSPGVTGSGSRTFMAWIYRQAGLTATKTIMDYGNNVAYDRNTFMVNATGYLSYLSGGTNSGITATVASVPEEEWVHVAFVYDGDSAYLYQNGLKVGSKAITGPTTPTSGGDFRIGRRIGGTNIWKGMLDEVSLWDVALTQQDVIDYACIDDPFIHDSLVAYYTFNEGTGTTLTDLVGGNDGTLTTMDETDWVASDVCAAGYNITFIVTEDDGTTPIENAEVDLDGDILSTNVNGEAIYYAYAPGNYNYTISKAGYVDETGIVAVVDDDVTVNVSLALTGVDYDITFVVTGGIFGSPIENALVDLDAVQQNTNASGETVFTGYLPGIYPYTITKDGYFIVSGSVEVIDDNVTVEISLIAHGPAALDFDGTNEYVQTTYPGVMGNNPRTFMAWIYLDEDNSLTKCIMDYGQNAAYGRNTFMVNGSEYLSYLSGGSGSGITATVATVPIGEWVHVAFVYDGSDAFLYQNGVEVGTKTFVFGVSTPSGGTNLRIGERVPGGSINFNGMIDEVSVWSDALTQQEVIDFACIGDNYSLFSNLGAYYRFNDATGTVLTDIVGAYDGTLLEMEEEDWKPNDDCIPGFDYLVLDLNVLLEGPFNETDMNSNLTSVIPTDQPFNTAPWNYAGTESAASIDADYVDWVLVELRDAAAPELATSGTMIAQHAGFVNIAGDVFMSDGNAVLFFDVTVTDNLYVVVYHRNHISVMSASALTQTGDIYTYDFTTALSQAYLDGQKDLGGGVYGMTSGDGNSDGTVDSADIEPIWEDNAGESGYLNGDYNLDGETNNVDKDDYWVPNNGNASSQVPM